MVDGASRIYKYKSYTLKKKSILNQFGMVFYTWGIKVTKNQWSSLIIGDFYYFNAWKEIQVGF